MKHLLLTAILFTSYSSYSFSGKEGLQAVLNSEKVVYAEQELEAFQRERMELIETKKVFTPSCVGCFKYVLKYRSIGTNTYSRYLTVQTKGVRYPVDPITTGLKIVVDSVRKGHPGL